jgi:hypothetical protein
VVDVAGGVPSTDFVTLCTDESGRVAVATTVYFVNGSSLSGSSHDTVADLTPPATAVTTGASGSADNATGPNVVDIAPVPAALVADTVKLYDSPGNSFVTVVDVAGGEPSTAAVTLCTDESGRVAVATTVYLVNGSSLSGACHDTVADLIPPTTSVITGASGSAEICTAGEGAELGP